MPSQTEAYDQKAQGAENTLKQDITEQILFTSDLASELYISLVFGDKRGPDSSQLVSQEELVMYQEKIVAAPNDTIRKVWKEKLKQAVEYNVECENAPKVHVVDVRVYKDFFREFTLLWLKTKDQIPVEAWAPVGLEELIERYWLLAKDKGQHEPSILFNLFYNYLTTLKLSKLHNCQIGSLEF